MQLNSMLSSLLSPTNGGCQSCPVPQPKRAAGGADAADKAGPASGVMAQISEIAKQMFAQMQHDGVAAESFDLHLDLRQLGLKVNANGSRSMEGHSLSVDLHIEAQQGDQSKSFNLSYSVEETWVEATEQAQQPAQAQGAKAPDKSSLIENLKKLVSLLDNAGGQTDQVEGLGALLAQIGKALEQMAKRLEAVKSGDRPGDDDDSVQRLQGYQLQEHVHIHAVHVQQVIESDQDEAQPTAA